MSTVEAVIVSQAVAALEGAQQADWLVVSHVGGKTTEGRDGKGHGEHKRGELVHVVFPTEPPAVACVQILSKPEALELVNGIRDSRLVGGSGSRISTLGISSIGDEVRQRVGLDYEHDLDLLLELGKNGSDRVDVLALVLRYARTAVAPCQIVAGAVSVVGAADLPVGSDSVAVTVGKVINDKGHQLAGALADSVLEDSLHGARVVARDLRAHVDPIGRRDVHHCFKGCLHGSRRGGDGSGQIGAVRRIDVIVLSDLIGIVRANWEDGGRIGSEGGRGDRGDGWGRGRRGNGR